MTFDMILGAVLLFAALAFILVLLIRSERIIKFIQTHNLRSAREIQRRWHGK